MRFPLQSISAASGFHTYGAMYLAGPRAEGRQRDEEFDLSCSTFPELLLCCLHSWASKGFKGEDAWSPRSQRSAGGDSAISQLGE